MNSTRFQQLQALLQDNPQDSFLLFAIAKEYEKAQDWQEALAYYLKLLEQDAGYIGAYYHLAKLYEKIEQPEKALEVYQRGMDLATAIGDRHALSELAAAKLNLEIEL